MSFAIRRCALSDLLRTPDGISGGAGEPGRIQVNARRGDAGPEQGVGRAVGRRAGANQLPGGGDLKVPRSGLSRGEPVRPAERVKIGVGDAGPGLAPAAVVTARRIAAQTIAHVPPAGP